MNTIIRDSLFFITGAAIASLITFKLLEKKYKNIADEEIESVRQMYERKLAKKSAEQREEKKITVAEPTEKAESNIYSSLISILGYDKKNKEGQENMDEATIEVIPPEDFGEYGYKCESLTYYADKVLTFDNDKVVHNVEKYVGSDALNTFGEYEDDSVFVRNHTMKTDYEILLDSRKYSTVVGDAEKADDDE